MSAGDGSALIWGVIVIVVLVSSLAARRLPWKQTVRYICIWIGIFGLMYGLFLFRGDIAEIWNRVSADLAGGSTTTVTGRQTVLRRTDGHFFAVATINGNPIEFLVDSGATVTTIGPRAARSVGIVASDAMFPIVVNTANGLANSWPVGEQRIVVGSIAVDGLVVHISERDDGANLLGMNFLNRLSSWQVQGDRMVLTP